MRIHYLQHVPFEDAANIEVWARDRGHSLTCTRLFEAAALPSLNSFDWLVIMGGPMNVHEHEAYPWLVPEKRFIEAAIDGNKYVLGVCLGAQLAADVLGAKVERNRHKEIGWFPVSLTEAGHRSPLFEGFPSRFDAFHWHGDTFSLPPRAERLAESEACRNQAFRYARHVVGLQFHLDYSLQSIETMIRHCGRELSAGPSIQTADVIRARSDSVTATGHLLRRFLSNLEIGWISGR